MTLQLNRRVVDKTGIAGIFDIQLDLHLGQPSTLVNLADGSDLTAPDPTAAFQAALQKVGLRLEPFKDTADLIVIDYIERPSEN